MGGSIGDALGAVTKPLQQITQPLQEAVGQTPLGGMLGASPMGALMQGEKPQDALQGALGGLAGTKMAKKQGEALMGGSLLTKNKNLKKMMMG